MLVAILHILSRLTIPVGWAQVGGYNDNGIDIKSTPLVLDCVVALDLKSRSVDQIIVQESLAGGSCGSAIPLVVQVPALIAHNTKFQGKTITYSSMHKAKKELPNMSNFIPINMANVKYLSRTQEPMIHLVSWTFSSGIELLN